jgi:probable HAF family extracellular repeat protein
MNVDARHATATSFVATDLGTLGRPGDSSTSEAFGVNDKGLVVGTSSISDNAGVFHAFLWSEQMGMKDLGSLGDDAETEARSITNDDVIAGVGRSGENAPAHAFVKRRGSPRLVDLSTLGGPGTTLSAMNAKGDVVGSSDLGDGIFHAFLWTKQDGIIRDLGALSQEPPGLTSIANAISDDGVVVGDSLTKDGPLHAFMWTYHNGMVDLGTLGGPTSSAQGVSNEDVVVGNSQTDKGEIHAFVLMPHTKMIDIGPDGQSSLGEKVNGRFVIGHFIKDGAKHGFVWTQKRRFVDVGTLDGDTTSLLAGVNARGLVVGTSSVDGTRPRAFVWTASSGIAMLPTPVGRSSHANAITGEFIVGAICDADGLNNCHATLWKPSSPSHVGREKDDDDED